MVSLTLSIPPELKKKMDEYPHIKWSQMVRAILQRQINEFEEAERLASKSKLTDADVAEFSARVDGDMVKHFKRLSKHAASY